MYYNQSICNISKNARGLNLGLTREILISKTAYFLAENVRVSHNLSHQLAQPHSG